MTAVYNDALKTARMQNVADLTSSKTIAAATGAGAAAKLVIGTSALSGATGVLATLPVPNPALVVSTPSAGTVVATLQGVPISVASTASGTAAKAQIRNNADTVIVDNLSVGVAAGSDIILNSVSITAPQVVTVTSGVITHG